MLDCPSLKKELKKAASPKKALVLRRFFKTGPGEYGEGDVFLGVATPEARKISKKYKDMPLGEVAELLRSGAHEERSVALQIMTLRFQEGRERKKIYDLYLKNTKYINNWDLVDISAYKIVGAYLSERSKAPLYKLAKSKNLWERRIAMVSTFYFIKNNQFTDALKIAALLLNDGHDLMHKAVGWMLREVGKRSQAAEECFLKDYCRQMPRTALRSAIERFPERKRRAYLSCRRKA